MLFLLEEGSGKKKLLTEIRSLLYVPRECMNDAVLI